MSSDPGVTLSPTIIIPALPNGQPGAPVPQSHSGGSCHIPALPQPRPRLQHLAHTRRCEGPSPARGALSWRHPGRKQPAGSGVWRCLAESPLQISFPQQSSSIAQTNSNFAPTLQLKGTYKLSKTYLKLPRFHPFTLNCCLILGTTSQTSLHKISRSSCSNTPASATPCM